MPVPYITPKIPVWLVVVLLAIFGVELFGYGLASTTPSFWALLGIALFYVLFMALFRHNSLPLVFGILFLTTYNTLVLYLNVDLPIALLFLIAFAAYAGLVWLLLRYATHLTPEHHLAYAAIGGFLNAQVILTFALVARDWNFRFETVALLATFLTYAYWRLACLQADRQLAWQPVIRLIVMIAALLGLVIITSPSVII